MTKSRFRLSLCSRLGGLLNNIVLASHISLAILLCILPLIVHFFVVGGGGACVATPNFVTTPTYY